MSDNSVSVKVSRDKGLGIFVTRDFAKGELIRQVNVIREVTEAEPLKEAEGELAEHCAYEDGRVMLYGEPDRYMNHSCDPNAYYDYSQYPPITRAIRDIASGEELTVDYLINNSGGDSWPCRCGAERCRGMTGTSFFDLPIEFQLEYLPFLAPWFRTKHADKINKLEAAYSAKN